MAAYRQLLAENHVEEILQDVKQNKNLNRKKELPVWLPLAESFTNGTRKADDAQPSGLFVLDIDEKGLTEELWGKVWAENLIEEFRIVYFAGMLRARSLSPFISPAEALIEVSGTSATTNGIP